MNARVISLVVILGWTVLPALAQRLDSAISIGGSATLWSDILKEERRLLVYPPPSYAKDGRSRHDLHALLSDDAFQTHIAITPSL